MLILMPYRYIIFVCLVVAAIAAVWLGVDQFDGRLAKRLDTPPTWHPDGNATVRPTGLSIRPTTAKLSPAELALKDAELLRLAEAEEPGEAVRAVIGLAGKPGDVAARDEAVNRLTRQLASNDVRALRLFLHLHTDGQTALPATAFRSLKNDVLDILLRQDSLPPGLGREMAEMYNDPDADAVWRDYCIQYMPAYFERMGELAATGQSGNAAVVDPVEERGMIRQLCWEATEERTSSLAGTALLSLGELARLDPALVTKDEVADKALEIAQDDNAAAAARMTALSICAAAQKREVVEVARTLAQVGESVPLRMAAIVTMGNLSHQQEDQELLAALAADKDKEIARAAKLALKKMK
jgi:hypothetical protein